MKVWHDDVRPAPPGWTRARTNAEAIALLETGKVEVISLDRDLGSEEEGNVYAKGHGEETGEDLVKYMIQHNLLPRKIYIHSWNIPGAQRMMQDLHAAGNYAVRRPFLENQAW